MGVLLDTTNCPFHWLGETLVALNDSFLTHLIELPIENARSLVGLLQPTRTS